MWVNPLEFCSLVLFVLLHTHTHTHMVCFQCCVHVRVRVCLLLTLNRFSFSLSLKLLNIFWTRLMHCKTDFLSNNFDRFVKIHCVDRMGVGCKSFQYAYFRLVWTKTYGYIHETNDTRAKSIRYFLIKTNDHAVLFSLCLARVCTHSLTNFWVKQKLVNRLWSQFISNWLYSFHRQEISNQVKHHELLVNTVSNRFTSFWKLLAVVRFYQMKNYHAKSQQDSLITELAMFSIKKRSSTFPKNFC